MTQDARLIVIVNATCTSAEFQEIFSRWLEDPQHDMFVKNLELSFIGIPKTSQTILISIDQAKRNYFIDYVEENGFPQTQTIIVPSAGQQLEIIRI